MPHLIPLSQAVAMTKKFRQYIDTVMLPQYGGKYLVPKSETFDKNSILDLLNQPGCSSLRIYYGMTDDLNIHAVLIGVDADDKDMVEGVAAMTDNADAVILEEAIRCPDTCPPASPLNTD